MFIAILSFNHPEITARAIESVLQQWPSNKTLLVHNGSEQKFINTLTLQFPNIHHLVIEKNKGYTGGVNDACNWVFQKSDWIFLITNDCELIEIGLKPVSPAFIAPMIYARKILNIDSLGGKIILHKARLTHRKTLDKTDNTFYIPGTSFLLHKEIFSQIGLFDESLGTYWEDVDYSLRCHKKNIQLFCDSSWKLLHRIGKTCHKHKYYTTFLFQRNRKIISRRHCPIWKRPMLEIYLLSSWIKNSARLIKQKKWEDLKLFWSAIW